MRRFLSCFLLCCFALWVRADWRAILTEEATLRKRDDRIFVTIDRALKSEAQATTEDAPYLQLYTTCLLAEGIWQFGYRRSYSENENDLPDLNAPAQSWTRQQVNLWLKQRMDAALEHAALFAHQPWERFPVFQNSNEVRWPNQSILYAFQTIASRISWGNEEKARFLQRLSAIAQAVDDEMLEGCLAAELLSLAHPYNGRSWVVEMRKRIVALRESKPWPNEVLASMWKMEADFCGTSEFPEGEDSLVRKMECLTKVVQLTQFYDLKQSAIEAIEYLRQAEVDVTRDSIVIHPQHRKLKLRYRNVTAIEIAIGDNAKPATKYDLPTPKQAYTYAETEIELPELPLGEVKLTISAMGNVRKERFDTEVSVKVATFTVGVVRQQEKGYFYIADCATGTPLENVEIAYAGQIITTNADGLSLFTLPTRVDARKKKDEVVTFRARGEELRVDFTELPTYDAKRVTPEVTPMLFTDRAIYRPGETIGWEVLLTRLNETTCREQPIPHAKGTLKVIAKGLQNETVLLEREIVASERGATSGEVQTPEDFKGYVAFEWNNCFIENVNVYEYRAPTFQVGLEVTSEGKPLTEPITFCVRAVDLSGVPLSGATVKWQVDADFEAKGEGLLNHAGEYEVQVHVPKEVLKGKPDLSIGLTATVVAQNGETETTHEAFFLPYHGYTVSLDILEDEWLFENKPFHVEVVCEPEHNAKGEIRIYKGAEADHLKENAKPLKIIPFEKPGKIEMALPTGIYRFKIAVGEVKDDIGELVYVLPQTRNAECLLLEHEHVDGYIAIHYDGRDRVSVGETLQCYALLRGTGEAFWTIASQKGLAEPKRLTSPLIEIPITEDLRSGFYVIAFAFDQGKLRSEEAWVNVDASRLLKVEATRFSEIAKPGSEQTWEITVDDPTAELVVTCYDQALDRLNKHFWMTPSRSYWSGGSAEGLFSSICEWLSERLPSEDNIIAEAAEYWGDADGMVMKKNAARSYAPGGKVSMVGMNAQAARGIEPLARQRTDFRKTAVWLPEKQLIDGKARFTFTLPDSTTTWRLMAYAFTPDGRTGILTRDCVARQEVMLKPYLPRNFYVGDEVTLDVRVDNTTEKRIETTVTLDGAHPQKVTVPAKGSTVASWTVKAEKGGERIFRFACAEDAVAITVPVLDNTLEVEDVYPVTLVDTRPATVDVALPTQDVVLTEQWNHNPSEAIKASLKTQLAYPYDCAEQTFAKLAAALLLEADAPKGDVEKYLSQLLAMRNTTDGMWPWFAGGYADPKITAIICIGTARLHQLQRAPKELVTAVCDTLQKGKEKLPFAAWAYACALLEVWPADVIAVDRLMKAYTAATSVQERRLLTIAAQRLGVENITTQGLTEVLTAMNRSEMWGCWWPQERLWWNWWHAPLESHVLGWEILKGANQPEAARGAAQWLLQHRRLNRWGSTRATTDAIYALLGEGIEATPTATLQRSECLTPTGKQLTFTRTEAGFSFGSVRARYRLPLEKVAQSANNDDVALKITRTIEPSTAKVGDTVAVTVIIEAAQPMEYLHVQVPRPANAETVQQTPHWDWQSGAYHLPGDAGRDIFIANLPRGVTTLRYQWKITHAGKCNVAPASATLMYAPDFAAHTSVFTLSTNP